MILSLAADARRTPAEIEAVPFLDLLAWHERIMKQKHDELVIQAKLAGCEIRQ